MAELPSSFRKRSLAERRELIEHHYPGVNAEAFGTDSEAIELADVMVESAVGYLALPIGVVTGFIVNDIRYDVPLATEEPSVIAAAGYAASLFARGGGFITTVGETVTTGELFVERTDAQTPGLIRERSAELEAVAAPILERMARRGGGWRGMECAWLPETRVTRVQVHVDVRDAMGANAVNSVVEALRKPVEAITGGRVVMAILTNAADRRVTTARGSIRTSLLSRAGIDGPEIARRIVLANEIALEDHTRAVTHNKGIMNGVTSLAIATGNDTRALEAAVHEYASRSGRYRALTRYEIAGETLEAQISLPVSLGTVGGAAGIHPTSSAGLALLGNPSAIELAGIAAAVGLAQNFAALFALVSEGIQRGHMGLHAHRIAWAAGARGSERDAVVAAMRARGEYGHDVAAEELARVRRDPDGGRP
ncbi:MAG: hydroxymethylglutaryl-CoA reductase, degradative [Spirochaetota bacterium]